jgi:anaerobic selenocysteine-containing dehydrogenase
MELSRRDFLKASGAGVGGIFLLGALSDGVALASPLRQIPLKKQGQEYSTICP